MADETPAPGWDPAPIRVGPAALLALFTLAAHGALVALDTAPQTWDPAHHLMQAMRLFRELEKNGIGAIADRWQTYHLYPPGGYLLGALTMLLTGPSIRWARHLQVVPLLGTVLLLYVGLARSGARRAALWAAAYLAVPLAIAITRVTYLENLLALGVVALAVRLATSRALATATERATTALIVGGGLLVKWNFALFAFALLVAWLLEARESALRRERIRSLAFALGGAAALGATWYLPHLAAILGDVSLHAYDKVYSSPPLLSAAALVRYPLELGVALGLPLAVLFVTALFGRERHSLPGARTRWLVVAVAIALVLLNFAAHKQGRFLQPLLGLVVWIVGARQGSLAASGARGAVVPALLVALNLGLQLAPADCSAPLVRGLFPLRFHDSVFPAGSPQLGIGSIHRCRWALDEVTEVLRSERAAGGTGVFLLPLDEHPFLNRKTLTTHVLAARKWSTTTVDEARWYVEARERGAGEHGAPSGFTEERKWNLPDGTTIAFGRRLEASDQR